jgi:predicted extracellular nuclease
MKTVIYFLCSITSILTIQGQPEIKTICVAFYNVENYFDPENDSLKNDDSFTFEGLNRWTYSKMVHKRDQIAKVILALNGWSPPDVVGLAEVENEKVIKNLCLQTGLKKYKYNYIHYDSPDLRGIEVAFIYRMDRVNILESHAIPILFPFDTTSKNRDILYVKAQMSNQDSIHFFINHWTSRYGGFGATVKKRNHYAYILRQKVDSILKNEPNAAIIIMGDFNDYPSDESLNNILYAREVPGESSNLVNLMYKYNAVQNIGSHKNEEFWGCLDQIIVSTVFFEEGGRFEIDRLENNIFQDHFLLVPDEKYGGVKTFRTYEGVRYKGGFSDHLPVYVRIKVKF